MGKFFDTLNKLEKVAHQTTGDRAAPGRVLQRPGEDVEKLRLYPSSQPLVPPLPEIEISAADFRLVCLREPASPAAESFRILRSKLLFPGSEAPPRAIMVTSAEPQDGKSLVAANLAVSIAQGLTSHVLLIDCDLRRPALHKIFGVKANQGLREYLETGTSVDSCMLKTQVEKLTLLPAGRPLDSPSELLASPKMRRLVEEIKGQYEESFLVLDTPPAHVFADAAPLFSMADGVILVVRYGKTSRELIKDAIASVGAEKILGVVFNASDQVQRDYKHYYHYYRRERESA
jgi:protein-tyrosine kinase